MTDDSADDGRRGKKIKPGDLLIFGNQYFLALGKNLAFSEQYQHLTTIQAELLEKNFLSLPALKLFHWMVEHHYTTYKSVVKLFFAHDIQKLLERENKVTKIAKKGQKLVSLATKIDKNGLKSVKIDKKFSLAENGQTLIVFPDLRTLFNSTDETFREGNSVACLLAGNTEKQKDVHRWEIKKGLKSVILCTYAEIFQDFQDLKKIIFVDPHKWYYASQQDPRYKVGDVLEEMQKLYGAELEILGV